MADTNPTPSGDHIEELLSQLKGIFGHLSETEQEEAKQKITPPPASARPVPPEPVKAPPPAAEIPPATKAVPTPELSQPEPVLPPTPASHKKVPEKTPEPLDPVSSPDLVEFSPLSSSEEREAAPSPELPVAQPGQEPYTPHEVVVPEGASLIPAAVFFPPGRLNEAKSVVDKVEKITPKFTKAAVALNVQALAVYDLKADLKSLVAAYTTNTSIKAVFFIIEKPIDDPRRKALIAELEPKGIYFQEIPILQIEKKAVYTDMLLGMVFFFDSQKPSRGETAA